MEGWMHVRACDKQMCWNIHDRNCVQDTSRYMGKLLHLFWTFEDFPNKRVKYPRFPWHPVPHPPRPLFPGWRINQNRPLPLTSPATGLSPGTSSLSGWCLTSLPAPIMNLLEPLPTKPLGWALKNVNQSPSAKLQTASPLSRLMICSCCMQKKTSGRAVGFLPKDDQRTHLLVVGLICFHALIMETETKKLLFFSNVTTSS